MNKTRPRSLELLNILLLVSVFVSLIGVPAGQSVLAHELASEMSEAATLFLKSLDETQAKAASFEFDDELRKDWQFIPMERKGLGLKSLKVHQHHLAMSLVQTALSHRGFSTSMKIMVLEQVLHEMENQSLKRDPAKYHLFFFGTPSDKETWGWRIEGHHLSISFTIVEGKTVVTTPAFFGASPAEVREGKLAGLRPLGDEEDLARALVKNLTVEQKEKAVLKTKAPSDVINGPGRVAQPLTPNGIAVSEMSKAQTEMLNQLIATHLGKFRAELAADDLKKITDAGLEKVHFAWAGKIAKGKPHYFRVQGPTFIMEYDNTQNKANHAHVVWRDFKNDFGEDLLKKHYETVPHEGSKKETNDK